MSYVVQDFYRRGPVYGRQGSSRMVPGWGHLRGATGPAFVGVGSAEQDACNTMGYLQGAVTAAELGVSIAEATGADTTGAAEGLNAARQALASAQQLCNSVVQTMGGGSEAIPAYVAPPPVQEPTPAPPPVAAPPPPPKSSLVLRSQVGRTFLTPTVKKVLESMPRVAKVPGTPVTRMVEGEVAPSAGMPGWVPWVVIAAAGLGAWYFVSK